ncbi:hypothetical protein CTAYLR_006488 [Chrysophaeum taylorii]|uniref:CCT domain-containing protein n=1 Tax=Chrysophaeum taylorii TaxID=2483200 RepID=A0AAD7ULU4_9STRA|nr:hypothetical protein CTAYLR_006488 [Chrysophaeum taylorii]
MTSVSAYEALLEALDDRKRSADSFFGAAPDMLFDAPAPAAFDSFVVHRVEAPGDLSHPYSFDRIENPVSLDSEDCESESESSEELPRGKPRLTIKLPVTTTTTTTTTREIIDDETLDREIVATIAPRKQESSPRTIIDARKRPRVEPLVAPPPFPLDARSSEPLETLRSECDVAKRPSGYVGAYSPEARKARVELFLRKRARRVWTKKVKYDVRKNFADSRMRVKGRFVKKEDEDLLRDLVSIV